MSVAAAGCRERVTLPGARVDRLTMDEALEEIDRLIKSGGAHQVVTLDSSMCVTAAQDPELRGIIESASLVTPDSAGVLWACRKLGFPQRGRVSGVEIVEKLCALSPTRGYGIYFLGAAPGIAEAAFIRMQQQYPGCRIVGSEHGYFQPNDEPAILERIKAASPDVLCVAFGIPRQEKWIARYKDSLGVPVSIGVGGTFDVLSGTVRRAPEWVQKLSLEWLYRFLKNPRKIGKLLTLPRFVWMVLTARPR